MPADAGVDERGAGRLDGAGEGDDLLQRRTAGHQVQHGEPVDQDEVGAEALARAAHDVDRETHPVLVAAAPAVAAPVGGTRDELVDQVALGAHDLDAVVAGGPREFGRPHEVLDGLLDLVLAQGVRHEGADRGLERARRHQVLVVGVPAEVQDLHRDPAALAVYRVRDGPVLRGLRLGGQPGTARVGAARVVGGDASGHHESDPAAGPLRVERGHPLEPVLRLFEPDVHGAHQHPVGQCGEPEVQGAQQVGVRGHGGASGWDVVASVVDQHTRLCNKLHNTEAPLTP